MKICRLLSRIICIETFLGLVILIIWSMHPLTVFSQSEKNQFAINVRDHGVMPSSRDLESEKEKYERWCRINEVFRYSINYGLNLYFPKGIYDVGDRNFPFRVDEGKSTNDLLDCNGIVIYGERGTIFKTSSKSGADVLQLNMVKNISFKNLEITATTEPGSAAGSNGISITNGFDNIVLENIDIYDLPGVDKGYWIDGGKGLTIQSSQNSDVYKGSVIAKDILVRNCAYGFRVDTNHISDMFKFYKTFKLDLNIKVIKAYQGISIEFGPSKKNLPANALLDLKVNANLLDCQQYVNLNRVIGGEFKCVCSRSESYDSVLKNKNNDIWSSKDGRVFGFLAGYAKRTKVYITGDVGLVDNKFVLGVIGEIIEPYNLKNVTEDNFFDFDLAGLSKTSQDVRIVSYDGKSLNNNIIRMSRRTAKIVPPEIFEKNEFHWL